MTTTSVDSVVQRMRALHVVPVIVIDDPKAMLHQFATEAATL